MKKINKIMVATATSVMSVGLITPLASCSTSVVDNSKQEQTLKRVVKTQEHQYTIECLDPLEMEWGKGGGVQFKATDETGKDVTDSLLWYYDDPAEYAAFYKSGYFSWIFCFTEVHEGMEELTFYVKETMESEPIYASFPIKWVQSLSLKYDGPTEFKEEYYAEVAINDFKSMQLFFKDEILDRSQYTATLISDDFPGAVIKDDGSFWSPGFPEGHFEDGTGRFKIEFRYEPQYGEIYHFITDEFQIHYEEFSHKIECSGDLAITRYAPFGGQSHSQYSLIRNGKDITQDKTVTFDVLRDDDHKPIKELTFDKDKKRFVWTAAPAEECKIKVFVRAVYFNKYGQRHVVTTKTFDYTVKNVVATIKGDEGFESDKSVEFLAHEWSKGIYLAWSVEDNPDIEYPQFNPAYASAEFDCAHDGVECRVEAVTGKNRIKFVPTIDDRYQSGHYTWGFDVKYAFDGQEKQKVDHVIITFYVEDDWLMVHSYSPDLGSHPENMAGSDPDHHFMNSLNGRPGPFVDVSTECNYKFEQVSGPTVPDGSIYVNKDSEYAYIAWKDDLLPGDYKFKFNVSYVFHGKTYTQETRDISLRIEKAELAIVNVPSSISGQEYTSGHDSNELRVILKYSSGDVDVTDGAEWSIEGNDKAKQCFFINNQKQIAWHESFNQDAAPSDSPFRLVAKYRSLKGVDYEVKSKGIVASASVSEFHISGGSTEMTGISGESGRASKAWVGTLSPGTIDWGDTISYKFIDLPKALEGKVHFDGGTMTWDSNVPLTPSDKPYNFKIQASLKKADRAKAYTSEAHGVKLYISNTPQNILEAKSWKDIVNVINDGGLSGLKKMLWLDDDETTVGLTKTIKYDSSISFTVRIIGENHDKIDDKNKAAVTFEVQELVLVDSPFDEKKNYWNNGSDTCQLRGAVLDWANRWLPKDLRNGIKKVKKQCALGDKDKKVIETEETVWLPSATELGATSTDTKVWAPEGQIYEYYKNDGANKRIKHILTEEEIASIYWTRSPAVEEAPGFASSCAIFSNGWIGSMFSAERCLFVAPCFCL